MKNKVVWFFHHYATPPSMSGLTRSYYFASHLKKKGIQSIIFSSSFLHYSGENLIEINAKYKEMHENDVHFIFLKTSPYRKSKFLRAINILQYYLKLFPAAKRTFASNGKPHAIIGSSAHPLAALAAIQLGKKYKCKSIVEVRDLWPESMIAYGILGPKSPLIKLMYAGEKFLYKNADCIVFTMEGGTKYIQDKKWGNDQGGSINLQKVYHINNGVDLDEYDLNKKTSSYNDVDLDNPNIFKVVYTGSVRKANNLFLLISAAQYIRKNSGKDIRFFIFGDGNERESLQDYCRENGIDNVYFKGRVERACIPSVLSKSNLNILNYSGNEIWKYGGSQNKLFEYLASGKPVLSTITMGYDIIEKYAAGLSLNSQTGESIANAIISITQMDAKQYQEMSKNARRAARDYDFAKLTNQLINVLEDSELSKT